MVGGLRGRTARARNRLVLVVMPGSSVGTIVLENVPRNAVVEVDGYRITVVPTAGGLLTIAATAGKHEVVVKQGRQVLVAESVGVDAGSRFTLNVRAGDGGRTQPQHR